MKKLLTVCAMSAIAFFSSFESKAQFSLGVQVGVALPMGKFGDAYGMGFGGLVTGYYGLNKNLLVNLQTGYLTFGAKDGSSTADATFSVIPINIGGRYLLSESSFRPYLGLDLGMFSSSSEVTVDLPFFGKQTTSASSTDFGLAPNVGAMVKMGDNMDLDITAKYNMIMTEGESTSFLGINAGVRIGF